MTAPPAGPSGIGRRTLTSRDLEIHGMTCASCATRVERKLGKLPGVRASVNYATHKARVLAPAELDTADLIRAVEAAGYGAREPDPALAAPPETDALRWRLALAAGLGLPVVVVSMVPAWQFPAWQWIALALTLPVYAVAGARFHRAALLNLRHRALTMDSLISLGTTAALAWSAYALATGPAGRIGYRHAFTWHLARGDGTGHVYLEAVVGILAFLLLGRYLEARATAQAGEATRALLALAPPQATRLDGEAEVVLPVADLLVGDRFVVRPGERAATDGEVVAGRSALDNSLLTGESVPVEASVGTAVAGGALNTTGRLVVRATRVGADTQLAQIAALVEEAQSSKSRVQRLVDRVAGIFVPVVVVLALATGAAWWLAGHDAAFAVSAAVAVLIIACPCALGLATPVALLVGTGRGAQLGIVVRGAAALEAARRLDTIVFDKTGTLTAGTMTAVAAEPGPGVTAADLLRLAGAAETGSEHPLARAVVALAGPGLPPAQDFKAEPGRGVRAVVEGHEVLVGAPAWVAERLGPLSGTPPEATGSLADATVVAVAWDGRPRGRILVRDAVRDSAAPAVAAFARLGLAPVLLTGDAPAAARVVAAAVGIDTVEAGVSPAGKVAAIAALQRRGHRVAMVGDGVNDAAALARADLGIALASGTDVAVAAADLTLMRPDLMAALDAVRLARACFATIRANLVWAFAYNVVALPIAAAGLLNPMIAGAAMAASSLFVVGNSLRLRGFRPAPRRSTLVDATAAW